MALQNPGKTFEVRLQSFARLSARDERSTPGGQVRLRFQEQGGLTIHSHLHDAPLHVGLRAGRPGSKAMKECEQLLAGIEAGKRPVDISIVSPTGRSGAALPGPPPVSLSKEQVELVGVARWPDGRFNSAASSQSKDYGRRFHTAAQQGGRGIVDGHIANFRQLWEFAAAHRMAWADPATPRRVDGEPAFSAGFPRTHPMRTPMIDQYAYLADRLAAPDAQSRLVEIGVRLPMTRDTPPDFMAHKCLQQTVQLNGQTIPLTELADTSQLR